MPSKLTTYIQNQEQLDLAITAGLNQLIFEYRTPDHKKQLPKLIKYARALNKQLSPSISMEQIFHDNNLHTVEQLLLELAALDIASIRINDLGLAYLIRKTLPACQIIYANQTANLNLASIQTATELVDSQMLSHLLSMAEIELICHKISSKFELLVHGNILLHHSLNHYLKADFITNATMAYKYEDNDHPGRYFTGIDNNTDLYLINDFHRCLLKFIPKILNLNLDSLLIDLRGADNEYFSYCLQAYQKAINLETDFDEIIALTKLKKLSPVPLKPGFFRANRFDIRLKNKYHNLKLDNEVIGKVLDNTANWITLELEEGATLNNVMRIITPENKEINLEILEIRDSQDNILTNTAGYKIIKLQGNSKIVAQSILLK